MTFMDSDMSNSTPNTEFSPPSSPQQKSQLLRDTRLAARKKLETLTLEEKVSLLTAADFWRTKAIPEKGIPAIKTSDGPNGARGGIFVGGTKVCIASAHPRYRIDRIIGGPVPMWHLSGRNME